MVYSELIRKWIRSWIEIYTSLLHIKFIWSLTVTLTLCSKRVEHWASNARPKTPITSYHRCVIGCEGAVGRWQITAAAAAEAAAEAAAATAAGTEPQEWITQQRMDKHFTSLQFVGVQLPILKEAWLAQNFVTAELVFWRINSGSIVRHVGFTQYF